MEEKKTAIIYASSHHGNTKKLVTAIAEKYPVQLIDIVEDKEADISGYDRIGIASGIVFSKYYPQMLAYLEAHLPEGKEVFFMHTAGDPREKHNASAKAITDAKNCRDLGTFCCKGYDTYGPFKLIGGINRKHPDQKDFENALAFYGKLENYSAYMGIE